MKSKTPKLKSEYKILAGVLAILALWIIATYSPITNQKEFRYGLFLNELAQLGVSIDEEPIEQPFMSVKGKSVTFDFQIIQVFEYESTKEMEREAKRIDSSGLSVGTTQISWADTPHFYKKGRIIVIYLGDNQKTIANLESILGEQFAGG